MVLDTLDHQLSQSVYLYNLYNCILSKLCLIMIDVIIHNKVIHITLYKYKDNFFSTSLFLVLQEIPKF